jgi:hypothetical protein
VWGFASPDVANVELRLTNCTALPLQIDAGRIFLHVFGAAALQAGVGPRELIAYGNDGTVISRQQVALPPVDRDSPATPLAACS